MDVYFWSGGVFGVGWPSPRTSTRDLRWRWPLTSDVIKMFVRSARLAPTELPRNVLSSNTPKKSHGRNSLFTLAT